MSLEKLKKIPIPQVASALGLKEASRHSSKKNRMYFNPFGTGSTPSIAVNEVLNVFKCHSTGSAGSVIDLVMFAKTLSVDQAIDWLYKQFNIERHFSPFVAVERTEKPRHVFIAEACLSHLKDENAYSRMASYLTSRAIAEEVIQRAVITKSIGFNLWHSPSVPVGQFGYGGEAVAFIARQILNRQIACVDMRYLNAEANGGVKTQCQGDKKGVVWCSDYAHLKTAQTVFIVESPINALSIETLFLGKKTVAAVATLGVNNVDETDWEFLRGKKVVIAFDFDKPKKDGSVPGLQAAWKLLDKLVLLQISAFLLKYQDWLPDWDVNDVLVKHQEKLLRTDRSLGEYFLLDDALIAGTHKNLPKSSVYLPPVDKENYWRFRTHPEHTSYIETRLVTESDSEGNKERVEKEFFVDVCGFRIAGLVKIIVQGYLATVKGGTDDQQKTYYAAIVQTRKDGHQLVKKVFTHSIYDLKEWMPIGAIFDKDYFNRALTILENKARNNTIDSINFVGLAWKGEKLVVVEPPQTSFIKIDQQCNYPNFIFPRGTLEDARTIISAFEKTFDSQAALMMLNWTLNAHLKLFTGFYPHCFIQADKGVGKSRLLEVLELVTGQRKFSADSLKSDFRLRTSLSGSSLPVAFDEISNMSEKSRKLLQDTLQTVYNFASTRTNSEMVEFVLFSPAMIAGEDIAFNSVISKTVVATLRACDRGAEIKVGELPKFPLRNWLEFLTRLSGAQFKTLYDECKQYMRKQLLSSDATSSRMIENYALQLAGWKLLCEFARYPENNGFVENLVIEMKRHIAETDTVRDPWIWVIEQIVSDIIQGKYSYPWTRMHINHIYPSGVSSAIDCLVIKPLEIMQHINQSRDLVDFREKLPIKTKNALINQMRNACVLLKEEIKPYIEWQGKKQRFHAYVAINLSLLSAYGVFLPDNVSSDEFYKGYDE